MKLDLPDIEGTDVSDEDWRKTPASVKRFIAAVIVDFQKQVEDLKGKVAELEEKLNANSGNSSKPPSSDPPWMNPKKRKKKGKKKRKRGGQPGHEGKTRDLVPPEEVDETIKCSPTECEHCGCEDIEKIAGDFRRHQTFDLPEIKPIVTEYQQDRYWCPDCEQWHTAILPLEAGKGMLGPGLEALVVLLAGTYHMSHRGIEEFLADAFNMKVSIGTISNTEARVSEALEEPVEELKTHVQSQPVVGADETGWKVAGRKAWMWVATTATACVFLVRKSRGADVAKELLGRFFKGILITDRWKGYDWIEKGRRQFCWAHLIRDFVKFSERIGRPGHIGDRLLEQTEKMFALWHRVRDGTLTRAEFQTKMVRIRNKVEGLLLAGKTCGHKKTEGTCREILDASECLWLFVDVEGVEPTNNASERAIRPGVLWRKNSFGTQSIRGNVFVERMMTVTMTCRLQGRSVLQYLTETIQAHTMCQPKPSLLPAIMDVQTTQLALAA